MLSSQTRDECTSAALRRLQTELSAPLCVATVLTTPDARLSELIGNVGFWRVRLLFIEIHGRTYC